MIEWRIKIKNKAGEIWHYDYLFQWDDKITELNKWRLIDENQRNQKKKWSMKLNKRKLSPRIPPRPLRIIRSGGK